MVEAYSEYPLARLMFWSAAIATVSLFIPSIKIGVMRVAASVDVRPLRALRLNPWYGVLKKRLLTLSSCSFEEATQISKSVLPMPNRHLGSGCPHLSIVALTTTRFPLLWTPTCIQSQSRSQQRKHLYVPKPPTSTPCVPAIFLTCKIVSVPFSRRTTEDQHNSRGVKRCLLPKSIACMTWQ